MSEEFFVVPEQQHNRLIEAAYRHRGYSQSEAQMAAKFSGYASWHGIRTHNAIKALHLDHLFGSGAGRPTARFGTNSSVGYFSVSS